jgi:site-specific recombinase XerD
MTHSLIRYRPPLEAPQTDLPLARPLRRRSFANEVLAEKFDQYLMVVKFSPHTRERYGCWVKQFGAFLDGKNFAAVKSLEVSAFLGTLHDRNLEKSTIASALYALRSFYGFLQLGDQVLISAPRQLQVTKISKRLPHALSLAEIKRILRAAGTPRNRALLELAFASGLRVSELANLRVEEVNLRARTLMVREGKWGRDRLALFGRPAAAALRAYLGDRTSGFVFQPDPRRQRGGVSMDRWHTWYGQWAETDERGKRVVRTVRLGDYEIPTKERARLALDAFLRGKLPLAPTKKAPPERRLSPRSILRMVVKVAARAKIGKRVGVHTFRHSFATACLNGGMDLRHIQSLMGHTTLTWTQKYLHVSMDRLKKIHTKFLKRG